MSYSREYFQQYRNCLIEKRKNSRHTTPNCRLIQNLRFSVYRTLKGSLKTSSTKDLLGFEIEDCKKRIEFQLAPKMSWNNIHIDHVKPICSFDVSKDEGLREAFIWKNTELLLKKGNLEKCRNFNLLDNILQFI